MMVGMKRKDARKEAPAPRVVAVSGGFDPVHVGHIRMFEEARKLGDTLVVILNNDHWLRMKKGFVFMPEKERKEVIEALGMVDKVVLTEHRKGDTDRSVSRELRKLRPHIFANGGDRKDRDDIPEAPVCEAVGVEMVFGIGKGGKVQSSSWLTAAAPKGKIEVRPWGTMERFAGTDRWWVKKITLNPGGVLSLQRHKGRHELWMAVEGEVFAELYRKDGNRITRKERKKLTLGKRFEVAKGELHRLSSAKGGSIIEFAWGSRVAEEDIERFADAYGRAGLGK